MLKDRIEILRNATIISDEVAEFVNRVIEQELADLKVEESLLEMFTTHLAMATQRVCTNQDVETLDDALWKEVQQQANFKQANAWYDKIADYAPCKYPEEEKQFLMMHLCNLLQ